MEIKLILVFIVLLMIINVNNCYDLCLSNPKRAAINQACKYATDCEYPLFCGGNGYGKNATCSKSIETGGRCESNNQCSPSDVCFNSKCKTKLYIGDRCVENKSYCSSSSCIKGKCSIYGDVCTSNNHCIFNNYCKSGKCIPVEKEGSPCDMDSSCSLTNACIGGKCLAKYQKPLGATCNSSSECQVFSGHLCANGKCSVYKQLLSKCKDNSDCGGANGLCMCKSETENVCVDLSVGALKNDKCPSLLSSFSSCMTRERCTENTLNGCPKCYPIFMCYQYSCFYMNQFFRSTQNYYKSFCSLVK
ncbi:hypothetical protein ACTFIU_008789 [Dictyostelium citrinum]